MENFGGCVKKSKEHQEEEGHEGCRLDEMGNHQTGALAGTGGSQQLGAMGEEDHVMDQEYLEVFRHAQDRRFHIFELWMHKPTWNTDFVNYKRLLSIEMDRPHLGQIATSWRGREDWHDFDFVKVHLPANEEKFHGFLGQRYVAYPKGDLGRVPLLVFFDGVRKFMTGTVYLRGTPHGISSEDLFDTLDSQHQCGGRHLCSVDAGGMTFWPSYVPVAPGMYLKAKQIDLEDTTNHSDGENRSDCSTTLGGESDSRDNEAEQEEREDEPEEVSSEKEDYSSMVQQRAAGVLPSRVRERSHPLWDIVCYIFFFLVCWNSTMLPAVPLSDSANVVRVR